MSISFNGIPADIRTPGQYIEADNSRAAQGAPLMPYKALLVAQKLATGTVDELIPTLIGNADAGEGYFGIGSQLSEMIRAFKAANPYTELWAVAIDDDGAATAGTHTVTFSGTATADGEVAMYIAGTRVAVPVTSGDGAAAVSTAMSAAIVAHNSYSRLPFTSAEATSVVTLTARNKGTQANEVDVRVNYQANELLPAGITAVIAAGVTGATDPAISEAITAMGDTQYNMIASSFNDATNIALMETELTTRWGPMEQKEGHFLVVDQGTQSALTSIGNARNSEHTTILEMGGLVAFSPTPTYIAAATAAAVVSASVSIDPARPFQTLALPGVLPPAESDRFNRTERNTLLTDGIATHYVDGGGVVRIERMSTTYQTNPLGATDPSYRDLNTMATLPLLRYEVRTLIALRFPRHKLADDGTIFDPGQAVVTPTSIKALLISLARDWEGRALIENLDQFKTDLIVERNSSDVNRVDMRQSPDLVNQLRVFAGQIQFLL